MARPISASRPTTGSIAPEAASSVRSRLYWSRMRVSLWRIGVRSAPVWVRPRESGLPNTARISV